MPVRSAKVRFEDFFSPADFAHASWMTSNGRTVLSGRDAPGSDTWRRLRVRTWLGDASEGVGSEGLEPIGVDGGSQQIAVDRLRRAIDAWKEADDAASDADVETASSWVMRAASELLDRSRSERSSGYASVRANTQRGLLADRTADGEEGGLVRDPLGGPPVARMATGLTEGLMATGERGGPMSSLMASTSASDAERDGAPVMLSGPGLNTQPQRDEALCKRMAAQLDELREKVLRPTVVDRLNTGSTVDWYGDRIKENMNGIDDIIEEMEDIDEKWRERKKMIFPRDDPKRYRRGWIRALFRRLAIVAALEALRNIVPEVLAEIEKRGHRRRLGEAVERERAFQRNRDNANKDLRRALDAERKATARVREHEQRMRAANCLIPAEPGWMLQYT